MPVKKKIEKMLAQMTLEEKLSLCHGCDSMTIGRIPRLGIGELNMADGPQGLRFEDGRTTTALPCGMALACTFDPRAAFEYGAVIGREALAANVQASLGPGFNLMRTPLNGRNFEYYGEDPVLAGEIASGYVRGCQSCDVAATPKHLALNNQEICRTVSSSNIDERTLRELYLRAFEIVTKKSGPWMMMSSYNKINGQYASQCRHVQQEIVKEEYGFDGVMVSDWGAAHDAYQCAMGGLDLEMGGNPATALFGEPLKNLVQRRHVPESVIDEKVRRILRLMFRTKVFSPESRQQGEINTERNRRTARELAEQGMVLLKNKGALLPLDADRLKRIAVIGPNADFRHTIGALENCGGSGAVHPDYEISPLEGLREFLGAAVEVDYAPGIRFANQSVIPPELLCHGGKAGLQVEYFRKEVELHDPAGKAFRVETSTDMELRWGGVMAAGRDRKDELDELCFAARWTGTLIPRESGSARLMISCARSRADVKLDGEQVISSNAGQSRLVQGIYEFEAEAGREYAIEIELVRTNSEFTEFKLLWVQNEQPLFDAALEAARKADAVLFVGGTNRRYDREAIGWADVPDADIPDLELPGRQAELIGELAKINPKLIVALVNGSVVSVESWIDRVPALLECWYGGMEAGRAIARVLFGAAAPGGKLNCTWAKSLMDYPCHADETYPGDRSEANAHTNYLEGIFIGYRHFDRAGIEPRFPFGFGLSYTTFACRVRSVECNGFDVTCKVEVTNTGDRRGAEVVQLYVSDPVCNVERPRQELAAFAKIELDPGESDVVELRLEWRDFAFYFEPAGAFIVEPGDFELRFGTSSRDIFATERITLE